ncbi:MAG: ABC transporter ATP-binding protein [Acholeplasma sp.]|nr:ABC transporter ATP-binding protein [Acholeplasma sp.]
MNVLRAFSMPYHKYLRMPLIILSLFSVVLSSSAVLFALLSKTTIDYAIKNHDDFHLYALLLIVVLMIQLFAQMINHYLRVYYQNKFYIKLQQDYFKTLLNGHYQLVRKTHSSSYIHLFKSDLALIADGLLDILPKLVFYILRFLLAFVVLYYLSPLFALLFLGLGLVLFGLSKLLKRPLQRSHQQALQIENKMYTHMTDSLSHIEVIKAFESESFTLDTLDKDSKHLLEKRMNKTKISALSSFGLNLFFGFGYAFSIIFGAYQISIGLLSIGALTALIQLVQNIQSPFSGLSNLLPKYYQMVQSIKHLDQIKDIPQDTLPLTKTYPFKQIEFKNVSFKYDKKLILDGFNLIIKKGDFIWIKGESGLGKTTLFKLLLGFLKPYQGQIKLTNTDQRLHLGEQTRSYFAYVPQTPYILSDTIYHNLTLGKQVPLEEVINVCKITLIHDEIMNTPKGYETVLQEEQGLSIGQLQRLSLARALLKNAEVLLLDEVTSSLDPMTEKVLLTNIESLKDKTILFISHRPLSKAFSKIIDLS